MSYRQSKGSGRLRHSLGWLSLGLGTVRLVAPAAVQRMTRVQDSTTTRAVVRLAGARQVIHGVGMLGDRQTPALAWTRVAGDALDLTALGIVVARRRGRERRRLAGRAALALVTTTRDVTAAVRVSRSSPPRRGPMVLTATTTIRRPRSEVYAFWRRLENLPTFMLHLDDVQALDDRHSRWRATAPFGRTVSWDAEVTDDVRNTRIGWQSTEKSAVPNAGTVTFTTAPDGVSTEVRVRMVYHLPGGKVGAAFARYFGEEPRQQVDDDLRRLKQVMETGEVVRSDGAPRGKRARHEFPQRPAQPLRVDELVRGVAA